MQSEPQQRRDAIEAAARAASTYVCDPSATNAAEVELAWQHLRRLDSVAHWRGSACWIDQQSKPTTVADPSRAQRRVR